MPTRRGEMRSCDPETIGCPASSAGNTKGREGRDVWADCGKGLCGGIVLQRKQLLWRYGGLLRSCELVPEWVGDVSLVE